MSDSINNTEDALALVAELHDARCMGVFAIAGAGTQAISWLLGVAGASRSVLELVVPYSGSAMADLLGYAPEQAVSRRTALDMARAAYRRALRLRFFGPARVVGVACTATIATDRTKRGEHRCHVAYWAGETQGVASVSLLKGLRDRAGEDAIASRMILNAFAEASGLERELDLHLHYEEHFNSEMSRQGDALGALIQGNVDLALVAGDDITGDARVRGDILPGSFNPLHDGHRQLAAAASRILDAPVTYELSITNVDKPPLEIAEIRRRVGQFDGIGPVAVTRAHVFYRKADLFPGCAFVIGYDTATRLVEPRYYERSYSAMVSALENIRRQGCRFLVAGRKSGRKFRTLDDVTLPRGFEDLFEAIPESAFREDVSSTQLRRAADAQG